MTVIGAEDGRQLDAFRTSVRKSIDAPPQADGREVFAHSAEVHQGNSGGPLINACGQVIGMNNCIIRANPLGEAASPKVKTGFALPSSDLAEYLSSEGVVVTTAQTCEPLWRAGSIRPPSRGVPRENTPVPAARRNRSRRHG
ncbi:trypsin-like peptidase domain-containing protein [uncultured Mameliella sp.]|uniref:trypsin-like peptidase domain-containing protein n=1 Tax=uncultured Mameliella sp. TaxID=1447087 RepID=UPI00345C92B7